MEDISPMESVQIIKIKGLASQTISELKVTKNDLNLSLLDFLRLKSIPIASSCDGEGVCRKCLVSDEILSCQFKVKEVIESKKIEITVNYL